MPVDPPLYSLLTHPKGFLSSQWKLFLLFSRIYSRIYTQKRKKDKKRAQFFRNWVLQWILQACSNIWLFLCLSEDEYWRWSTSQGASHCLASFHYSVCSKSLSSPHCRRKDDFKLTAKTLLLSCATYIWKQNW